MPLPRDKLILHRKNFYFYLIYIRESFIAIKNIGIVLLIVITAK